MSQAVNEHREAARDALNLAVVTVSDTRTVETDTSGATIVALAEEAGHTVLERHIIPDEPAVMSPLFEAFRTRDDVDAILVTGGTGISPRDQTYETVSALLTKPLPGYGELFLNVFELRRDWSGVSAEPGHRGLDRQKGDSGDAGFTRGGRAGDAEDHPSRAAAYRPRSEQDMIHSRFLNRSRNRSSYSLKTLSRSSSRLSS